MADLRELRAAALAGFLPPEKVKLSDWTEDHLRLPAGVSATPGDVRLWGFQRELADAIGDESIPRVSCLKAVRCGYSTLLVAAVAAYAVNDPSSVIVLVPTEADARNFVVHSLEPVAEATPILKGVFIDDPGDRNTLLQRRYRGGSLKVIAARAPRNLRAHTARVLLCDEVDAMEITAEGNPLLLAEKRTLSYSNRKIVHGSTPTDSSTSLISAEYAKSDKRVYRVPCPECGEFSEIVWKDIRWDSGKPETACWCCPECGCLIPEAAKPNMVARGKWVATAPEVQGHAGFKLSALVSLMPNAAWPNLVAEFLAAKDNTDDLRVFVNTVLAETFDDTSGEGVDDESLLAKREAFDLSDIPEEVVILTGAADVQKDRIEFCSVGWTEDGTALVLDSEICWGEPTDSATWAELDALLQRRFQHKRGGSLTYDAVLIDSGAWADHVYAFTRPRQSRRIWASKGVAGFKRVLVERSKARGLSLFLVASDVAKTRLLNALIAGTGWRFGLNLGAEWFSQLTSERRVVKYQRGMPTPQFVRISGRAAEALDMVAYNIAARALVQINPDRRRDELAAVAVAPRAPQISRSKWLSGQM